MKQVVIVHGFKGKPETNWKPWLKSKLETRGFEVKVPAMPDTETPEASKWVAKIHEVMSEPDGNTYLVGHSLGTITILLYLESLRADQKVGGVVLVAGFGERFKKYTPGSHDSFFEHDLDWQLIKKHCQKFVAIHSEDDPGVDIGQLELFRDKLGAKAIKVNGMKHFSSQDGVFEVPIVFDELLEMSK